MAAAADRPGRRTTRRRFLAGAACALLAAALGRRWLGRDDGAAEEAGATQPRRADNLREVAEHGGIALRPVPADPNGPVFRLNRSAALVWQSIDGRRTVAEIAAIVGAAYGLPTARAQADTTACLSTLAAQGLVFGLPAASARDELPA